MTENSWEQFIETCRQGLAHTQQELKEIDLLIQQTSSELDRLMQANTHAVARRRQIESSFDTVPREDIRRAYTNLIESQQRLFTMRGQLEKLQSDQKHLSQLVTLYQQVLEFAPLEGLSPQTQEAGQQKISPQAAVISIIEAQEQERLRLSRQMHDGPAQSLTNLVLQAEICERLFDRNPERVRTELAELKNSVIHTFKSVKEFIFELRPMMLDDLGLVPTMRRYVDGVAEEGFKGLTLQFVGKERRLAPHQEVTIFRVTQALIHLGRNQSRASNIAIRLNLDDHQVDVTYEDDGMGFDIDEALSSSDAAQLNLPMLRERIEMLGGTISFHSSPGKGLRARLTLPVEPEGT